jgi:hypothetical protein
MPAGDGGNVEGLATTFIDVDPPAYCANSTLYYADYPAYQPTIAGQVRTAAGAAHARLVICVLWAPICRL